MHPNTKSILRWLDASHLPPHLAAVVKPFADLGVMIATRLQGPEATVALRKLVEAKDAAVRAAVAMAEGEDKTDAVVAGMLT